MTRNKDLLRTQRGCLGAGCADVQGLRLYLRDSGDLGLGFGGFGDWGFGGFGDLGFGGFGDWRFRVCLEFGV